MALIPVEKVEDVFEQLCIDKPDYSDKIDNFLDYILLKDNRNDERDRYVFLLKYGTIMKVRNEQTMILKDKT